LDQGIETIVREMDFGLVWFVQIEFNRTRTEILSEKEYLT
jgi:hypothetical protein